MKILFFTILATNVIFSSAQNLNSSSLSQHTDRNESQKITLTFDIADEYGVAKFKKIYTFDYVVATTTDLTQGLTLLHMQLQRFRLNFESWTGQSLVQKFYYDTEPSGKYRDEILDATFRTLLGKKFKVYIHTSTDSVSVQGADSAISEINNAYINVLEGTRLFYSNDFFEGFFNSFMGMPKNEHNQVGQTWTLYHRKESLAFPSFSDNVYRVDSIANNAFSVTVSGESNYRNPSWSGRLEGSNYQIGTVNGRIFLDKYRFFPNKILLKYLVRTPKNKWSTIEGVTRTSVLAKFTP